MSKNISEMEKKWSSPGSKIGSTSREALTKTNMIHIFFNEINRRRQNRCFF